MATQRSRRPPRRGIAPGLALFIALGFTAIAIWAAAAGQLKLSISQLILALVWFIWFFVELHRKRQGPADPQAH
ncbi:hypothetical protein [Gulosibacter sp. 10]|uniref:hypothetical protein n=1 Tax=Gulosibacter sp. 10 TaxID=1255570 RepID=UPI00097F2A44|nr:hypothetical protein [Gulosibacter sp. 10]SJM67184.1 hypothetical protein FM112_12320 [Gulosibacter sp. 10]